MKNHITSLLSNKHVKTYVSLVITVGILIFFSYAIYKNWNQLNQYEWQINYRNLVLAFFGYPINLFLLGVTWHLLINSTGAKTSLPVNFIIYCYSNLPKRIPGTIWYIVGRVYLYQEHGINYASTVLTTIIETIYLILAGLMLCVALLPFTTLAQGIGWTNLGWFSLISILLLPLILKPAFLNKILDFVQKRLRNSAEIKLDQTVAIIVFSINVGAWIWGGVILYFLGNGITTIPLNYLPDIILAWTASGVAGLGTALILNGMGVKEVTLALLLSNYLALPTAAVISLLFRLLITVGEVVWSLIFVGILKTPYVFSRKQK